MIRNATSAAAAGKKRQRDEKDDDERLVSTITAVTVAIKEIHEALEKKPSEAARATEADAAAAYGTTPRLRTNTSFVAMRKALIRIFTSPALTTPNLNTPAWTLFSGTWHV